MKIENLEQPYPELYGHLKAIHDRPNQTLESKVDEMRESLVTALRCEESNSPKAIQVSRAIQNLVTLYPRNQKNEEGQLICPISFDPLDLNKPEENFYSSVSSYIFKKNSIQRCFEVRPQEKNDLMNRRPFSRHELQVLRPNWEYIVRGLLENNDRILRQWDEQFEQLEQRGVERLFERQLVKSMVSYCIMLVVVAYICYEIFDQKIEVPIAILGAGTFLALLAGIVAITANDENNQRTATGQVIRFGAVQQNQPMLETVPLNAAEENHVMNNV